MAAKPEQQEQEPTPDPRDEHIIQLQSQVNQFQSQLKSMESFANIVVEQRNAAQNEAAQYKAQLIQQLERNQKQ